MALKMNPLTTEYVHVDVTSTGDLLSYPVFFALPLKDVLPDTWFEGSWDPTVLVSPFRGRVLVGPEGVVTLVTGSSYDLWIKILDNPELPVRKSGVITVL